MTTPEEYWAYKAFIRDDITEEALRSSEIFTKYREAEMKREVELKNINAKNEQLRKEQVLKDFDDFEKKVQASPELKAKLKQVKAHLDTNPDLAEKADPNFIAGINMLNLED